MKNGPGALAFAVLLTLAGCSSSSNGKKDGGGGAAGGPGTCEFVKHEDDGVGKAKFEKKELPPSVEKEEIDKGGEDDGVGEAKHKKKKFAITVGTTVNGTCPRCDKNCQFKIEASTAGTVTGQYACEHCQTLLAVKYSKGQLEVHMVVCVTCPRSDCKKRSNYKISIAISRGGGRVSAKCLSCKQDMTFGVPRP